MTAAKERLLRAQRACVAALQERARKAPNGSCERAVVLECLEIVVRQLRTAPTLPLTDDPPPPTSQ